jgi:hypothetical protein
LLLLAGAVDVRPAVDVVVASLDDDGGLKNRLLTTIGCADVVVVVVVVVVDAFDSELKEDEVFHSIKSCAK